MSKSGAGITLPQVYRMKRELVQKQGMTCIYMLTMRHKNRIEPARARWDQRSLNNGFVRPRRPGLGILTGMCNQL